MAIEEQVAIIYTGVKGYLDKIDPSKITKFEKEFSAHIKSQHPAILKRIKEEGKISDDLDAQFKTVVSEFVSSFIATEALAAKNKEVQPNA